MHNRVGELRSDTRTEMPTNAAREAARNVSRAIGFVAATALVAVAVFVGPLLYRGAFPTVHYLCLPDRIEAWLYKNSTLRVPPDFGRTRTIQVDGEVLLKVPAGIGPLRIRAPVLSATVPVDALLVVTSSAQDSGAQVEVLQGTADIEPAYPSRWHESAHAVAGEVVLLSRDVDLMEHETIQDNDVPSWVPQYVPSPSASSPRQ